jgi:glycosyltransferase involved in cell wall biosynthesis
MVRPKVLHIIDSFETGGTERQAIQLVRLQQASGCYHIHLACLQKRGELLEEAERLGLGEITEYPLNSFYDRNMVIQLRRCASFLKEQKIDIIHTHDFYTNIFGMTAARLAKVPVRIASKRETKGLLSPMQKRVERYAYRLAHSVITNAGEVRKQLITEGVRADKITTVYNGLDMQRIATRLDLSRKAMLSMLNLPHESGRRFVTIVANVQHAVKDHPTFLRAAARVHKAVPEATFVIAGEGRLMNELRAFAEELGIERNTFFIGRCQRVAELLSISNVCVLSSRAEGFSNSILEYMAAARPVVVTDVGGAREAVIEGETGFIVPAGDDENMAERIMKLLRDPERASAMGTRGKLTVAEKFSCETQVERTTALYEHLLARPAKIVDPALKNLQRRRA